MIPLEAVEAIIRLSLLDKWQTFDMVSEWALECWGEFISEGELEQMWSRRTLIQ